MHYKNKQKMPLVLKSSIMLQRDTISSLGSMLLCVTKCGESQYLHICHKNQYYACSYTFIDHHFKSCSLCVSFLHLVTNVCLTSSVVFM